MRSLIIICLFITTSLWAQDVLKSGFVLEEDSKGRFKPLPFANVYWLETKQGTITDSVGFFSIYGTANNQYLIISHVGYQNDTIQIDEFSPDSSKLTIILKNSSDLGEVEVEYRRKNIEISHIDVIQKQYISQGELFKAACCNLSESFETNPSVDVSFADAVTGTREIKMLGLAGKYAQVSLENMPYARGLISIQGLTYIPGPWIESIQLSKGIGSVVNGYEMITGQINVELFKPDAKEKVFLNGYLNQSGRSEINWNSRHKISKYLSTAFLLHGNYRPFKIDNNGDGFMDNPTGYQFNGVNRWKWDNYNGLQGQLAIKQLYEKKTGGQMNFEPTSSKLDTLSYGIGLKNSETRIWGKTGYVFSQKKYQSIGFQYAINFNNQDAYFGTTTYSGKEQSAYGNLIYQSIIGNTDHQFKTGLSFLWDHFDEQYEITTYQREELIPGSFFEYSFIPSKKLSLLSGIRLDYHNQFGFQFSPRFHIRYSPQEETSIRVSGGKGWRMANIFTENTQVFASSRNIFIQPKSGLSYGYGLSPEIAWNMGVNFSHSFRLNYREGVLLLDFYRTEFTNQVVMDREKSPQAVYFYNLSGKSYSNSLQVQLDYELVKQFDLRLAYRFLDVQTNYTGSGLLTRPFTAQHRTFFNLVYETKRNWSFDATVQWIGEQRIPNTASNPLQYRLSTYSPSYFLVNGQVSKSIKERWDVYVGVENLLNYQQYNPIVASDAPFGNYFDASLVWGPIFGRMLYAGFRLKVFE